VVCIRHFSNNPDELAHLPRSLALLAVVTDYGRPAAGTEMDSACAVSSVAVLCEQVDQVRETFRTVSGGHDIHSCHPSLWTIALLDQVESPVDSKRGKIMFLMQCLGLGGRTKPLVLDSGCSMSDRIFSLIRSQTAWGSREGADVDDSDRMIPLHSPSGPEKTPLLDESPARKRNSSPTLTHNDLDEKETAFRVA